MPPELSFAINWHIVVNDVNLMAGVGWGVWMQAGVIESKFFAQDILSFSALTKHASVSAIRCMFVVDKCTHDDVNTLPSM